MDKSLILDKSLIFAQTEAVPDAAVSMNKWGKELCWRMKREDLRHSRLCNSLF